MSGEHCAPEAASFVNAQLKVWYKRAVDCISKHHNPTNKPIEHSKYSHALAEFDVISHNQTMFHAEFDKPEMNFICNHYAILQLTVKEGSYYRLDCSKSSTMQYSGKDDGYQPLSKYVVRFRLPFETRDPSARGNGSKIGKGQHLARLIVLNLQKAKFVSSEPATGDGFNVLISYLTDYYLAFLRDTGSYALYLLPEDCNRIAIGYMRATIPEVNSNSMIHSVSVDKINAYLSSVWLKAAMLTGGDDTEWESRCLAEYRTTWRTNWKRETGDHFILRLGAPYIKPVCSREAIVSFVVEKAQFYEDVTCKEPGRVYRNCKVEVLVDIINEPESDRFVQRCMLDVASAHYYDSTGFKNNDELAAEDCERISEFLSSTYLEILESIGLHVIYSYNKRLITTGDPRVDSGEDSDFDEEPEDTAKWELTGGCPEMRVIEWRKMITHGDMDGFDQVMVISQSTINAFFQSLWSGGQSDRDSGHALVKWNSEEFLNVHFMPITLHLLSNKRAIVLIRIESGHLKVSSEPQQCSISGWHLAFEVNLEKVTHSELKLKVSESWTEEYKESNAYKEHGGRDDRVLEHIVLDFSHAEFVYELSSFEGPFPFGHPNEHRHMQRIKTAMYCIKNSYLPHLAQSGFGIINTVPVWKTKTNLTSVSLTQFDFHVYSNEITRDDCKYVTAGLEPVIAVRGMTEFRTLPAPRLEYSSGLTNRGLRKISYGTVVISRSTFMEKLLDTLGLINAHTTIIPLPSGVVNGEWRPRLTTWSEQNKQSSQKCEWNEVSKDADFTKYMWKYEGSSEINNGTYNICCSTRNYLELPNGAARLRSMDIKLYGETVIETSFKSAAGQGSSKAIATWNAEISIQSEPDGLCMKDTGSSTPAIVVPPAQNQSGMLPDLRKELKKHFPKKIDMAGVLDELKVFKGVWHCAYPGLHTYCLANPVFTQKGDVIFELRLQGEGGAQTARRNNGGNRSSSARTISRQSSQAALTCGGSFLQKAKAPMTTRAPQNGERSSTPSILNGRDDDRVHANGNGHSLSSPYRATASIEGGDVEHEPETVEGFGESEQAL